MKALTMFILAMALGACSVDDDAAETSAQLEASPQATGDHQFAECPGGEVPPGPTGSPALKWQCNVKFDIMVARYDDGTTCPVSSYTWYGIGSTHNKYSDQTAACAGAQRQAKAQALVDYPTCGPLLVSCFGCTQVQ